MKKALIIVFLIIFFILGSITLIPIIFKDDIRKSIDSVLAEQVDAQVFYDAEQFDITLFQDFPKLTVSVRNFGIMGVGIFENDTLTSIRKFQITVDLKPLIFDKKIKINKVLLDKPQINILVDSTGKANYDIQKTSKETPTPSTEEKKSSEESSNTQIAVKNWEIRNANIFYNDKVSNVELLIENLNNRGEGNFTLDVFDLSTETSVESLSFIMGGVKYLSDKQLQADVTLNINFPEATYTFKENKISLNQFHISADGFVKMPDENMEMDINLVGKEIDLKDVLSLIPGSYQDYLEGVEASAKIAFDAKVQGSYTATEMPKIQANLNIEDGNILYQDYPIPMEEVFLESHFNMPSTDLTVASFEVNRFHLKVDGEEVNAYLKLHNFENYHWDMALNGNADLEKITKIYPSKNMTLAGKINADIKSQGKMSDVEEEKYDQIFLTGNISMKQFMFNSEDIPHILELDQMELSFDPTKVNLLSLKGRMGKSDFSAKGNLKNHIAYFLRKNNQPLIGNLNFYSKNLNVDEWIPTTQETVSPPATTDTSQQVTEEPKSIIPRDIEFNMDSRIDKIIYEKYDLSNFAGKVKIKDGRVIFDSKVNLLSSGVALDGMISTLDPKNPSYDLNFKINKLSIPDVVSAFELVKKYAPILEKAEGFLSTKFNVRGDLKQDFSLILDKTNFKGVIQVLSASISSGEFLKKLEKLTVFGGNVPQKLSLNDTDIKTEIRDGKMYVYPFEFKVNNQKATLQGNNTLEGVLDYKMVIKEIPTGDVGNEINNVLSSLTNDLAKNVISDKIDLDLGITGHYSDPKINILGTSFSAFKRGKNKKTATKEIIKATTKQALDSAKNEVKKEIEKEVEKEVEKYKKKAVDELKNRLKDIFGGG